MAQPSWQKSATTSNFSFVRLKRENKNDKTNNQIHGAFIAPQQCDSTANGLRY